VKSKKQCYLLLRKKLKIPVYIALIIYLTLLVYVTLLTKNDYVYGEAINLDLFRTIILMWNSGNQILLLKNVLGNLILFFPLGCILPLLFKRANHFISSIVYGFLASLLIETMQYTIGNRVFDVDDLVLNTAGAILGWIFFRVCFSVYYFIARRG
jgi:glycopeptide antibiotics resistance protein